MFEKASRIKLRFESSKGYLSVEDLWDLPLTSARSASLESVGQALVDEIKEKESSTFRIQTDGAKTAADPTLAEANLKFEILKHIIAVRQAENTAELEAKGRKEKKAKILDILAQKQDDSLKSASEEDLKTLLASL